MPRLGGVWFAGSNSWLWRSGLVSVLGARLRTHVRSQGTFKVAHTASFSLVRRGSSGVRCAAIFFLSPTTAIFSSDGDCHRLLRGLYKLIFGSNGVWWWWRGGRKTLPPAGKLLRELSGQRSCTTVQQWRGLMEINNYPKLLSSRNGSWKRWRLTGKSRWLEFFSKSWVDFIPVGKMWRGKDWDDILPCKDSNGCGLMAGGGSGWLES